MNLLWTNDLPERVDAMTAKELRQAMRRTGFVLPFLAIQLLALVALVAEFRNGHTSGPGGHAGVLNLVMLFGSGPFWLVVAVVCMLLMPLGGLLLMSEELEEGNHELLLLTRLNRWRVVTGKFVALWGLSVVTFVSLLPYVVVRYLVGGIEWWHEAACAATVITGSAMIGAGAIGASAFRGVGARVVVFLLFLASMAAGSSVPLAASAMHNSGCGLFYHVTVLAAASCYTMTGLALARSRLRLAVAAYEMKPGWMMVGLLVFSPFAIVLFTVVTLGFGGFIGLAVMGWIAMRADVPPRPATSPLEY